MPRGRFLDLSHHLPSATFLFVAALAAAGFAGIFIYTGLYNIGADAPHSKAVYGVLDTLRENAIAHHARNITPPQDLTDPKRIATGAGLYSAMCSSCHGAPGEEKSDLAQGLYPQAPNLATGQKHTAAQQFWIIKHGVKLSAMPAWGKTHNDQLIWNMVAFIRTLPKLSPQQYKSVVASAPSDDEAMGKDMPGMAKSGEAEGAAKSANR